MTDVMEWQPIETAPVDKPVRVGGYVKGYDDQAPLQWREDVRVVFETERGWFGRKRIVRRWAISEYTHWMPLPEPPRPPHSVPQQGE